MQVGCNQAKEAYYTFAWSTRYIAICAFLLVALGDVMADELDCWIWRSPRPHNQETFALTRGGGLWLSLGHNGTVATSIDGIEWDLTNVGTNSPVVAGAYGNGVFIASAPSRGLYISTDAHNWIRTPFNPAVNSLAFGAGRFVGLDGTSSIWTSTNGVDWTSQRLGVQPLLSRICHANGMFFALGKFNTQVGIHFISADGENWSGGVTLDGPGFRKVVHGNGIYLGLQSVLGATSVSSEFRTSVDGINWTPPLVFPGYQMEDVVFADGQFFAVEISGRIMTSTNGMNWTEQAAPALFAATKLSWAEGIFVSAGVLGGLSSSADGLNWTRRSIGTQNSLVSISRLNGLLFAVGGSLGDGGGNLSKSTVAFSADGKDWLEPDPKTTNSLSAAAYGNGRYVAVGVAGTITTSLNATNWTALSPINTTTLNGVAFGSGRFVAVGGDATRATILHSSNGLSWTAQAGASSFSTLYAVTFAQNQFIAVGRTNVSRQGTILTSPDGLAWTPRTPTTTNSLRAIGSGNGMFVATGDRGAIVSSIDGINWTDLSRNTTRSLRGVAYGNGWWVIVTDPSAHYTSPDGVNWTFRSSLNQTTIFPGYGVAFGGDSFFVVSSWGQILESMRFHPPAQDTLLRLHYASGPFLTLKGPECRQYDIQASSLMGLANSNVPWQTITSVSNRIGTVILPLGGSTNPANQFFRAILRP